MLLTPTELERLTIFTTAELARRHKQLGIKLSQPEAAAYIVDELLVGARQGRTLAELMSAGSTLLSSDDVMDGVSELIRMLQFEGMFPDGAKMITVHDPIRPGKKKRADTPKPGEVITAEGDIELNAGRRKATVAVLNTADRAAAVVMRLDVPAGASARFEPGENKPVTLVAIGGTGAVSGFNGLTEGSVRSEATRERAIKRARAAGFKGA